jgi:RimJ/RimL family protein N-acetyltransferase
MKELPKKIIPPVLTTERLRLRAFKDTDAKSVQLLAGDPLIAATTASIPHPYGDGLAEAWIAQHEEWFAKGTAAQFAVVSKYSDELLGCMSFFGMNDNRKAEIGYWITVNQWGKGYCSEAATALLDWGFTSLDLYRVIARHMVNNPASGKVMRKLGMTKEGTLRQDAFKNGAYYDVDLYGILRDEWVRR